MPKPILTDRAIELLSIAFGSEAFVEITHVALGDGGGATYEATPDQTQLVRELARIPITKRHVLGANAWRVVTEFPPDTPEFWVREIGFFDTNGELIAIWADEDMPVRQTGAVSYLVSHELSFASVSDGLIVVTAPDDEVFDLAVATAHSFAVTHLRQFQIMDRLRDLHGPF